MIMDSHKEPVKPVGQVHLASLHEPPLRHNMLEQVVLLQAVKTTVAKMPAKAIADNKIILIFFIGRLCINTK